jgi:L-malate glycosyltransferase
MLSYKDNRIAYLIDTISSDKAGTEKQLLNIIKRIPYDCILICLYESTWMTNNKLPCETVVLGYRGFLHINFLWVLAHYIQCLKDFNITVVQAFFEDSMFIGCMGKMLSKQPHKLVISRRDLGLGADEPVYHKFYKLLKPLALRAADSFAVNAHAIKQHLFRNEKIPNDKICVIRNGVDLPTPPQVPPSVFLEFEADVWIVIVANLKPIKRVDLLLRAFAKLQKQVNNQTIRAVILGDGKLYEELNQLAKELCIADHSHFMGSVKNVSDYLFNVDIGVLCSDKEGLSNAILEYMACGLPVVATDAGGNRELVDYTNGICVPTGDLNSLTQSLHLLITAPDIRKKLGIQSLKKIQQDFVWERTIQQWTTYYNSLLLNSSTKYKREVNEYS